MAGPDRNEDERRADVLYAARSAILEAGSTDRRFGVAELFRFLNNAGGSLTQQEQRMLFADHKLAAAYRRIKEQLRVIEMPMLAAASDGGTNSRQFPGGSLRIHPSRMAGQAYVVIRFDAPTSLPRSLLLEGAGGEIIKQTLPTADSNGEVLMVVSEDDPAHRAFLKLLSEPTTVGTFLA